MELGRRFGLVLHLVDAENGRAAARERPRDHGGLGQPERRRERVRLGARQRRGDGEERFSCWGSPRPAFAAVEALRETGGAQAARTRVPEDGSGARRRDGAHRGHGLHLTRKPRTFNSPAPSVTPRCRCSPLRPVQPGGGARRRELQGEAAASAPVAISTGPSAFVAGPESTSPAEVNRLPWHGQSQHASAPFHRT